ncbi:MAG: hypothetical protein CMM59_15215 [Rhodospirillaceae bacterium]|nr:hypothetical protein [Rhodospirillaceae bacterium]
MRNLTAFILYVAFGATAAFAQSSKYPAQTGYGTPNKSDERLRELTNSINKMLDEGERKRLADPWFLKDLRDLVNRYHNPWSKVVLSDDFSARGPAPSAPWQVTAGEFRLDWRYGLRSLAQPPRQQSQTSSRSSQQQGDAVQQLFGALLNQALKGNQPSGSSNQRQSAAHRNGVSEIIAPVAISNAFSFEADITARPLSGSGAAQFELAVYQGRNRAGYELIVAREDKSDQTFLRLIRVNGRGGAAIIEQATVKFQFDPETPTALLWTRQPNGEMEVTIQGTSVLRTGDRGFRDPFDGAIIRNRSGDIAIRRAKISGT